MTGCTRANKSKLLYALACTVIVYDKLHSAIWEQTLIALVCIIIAYDRLHSAIWEQSLIALACIIIAYDRLRLGSIKSGKTPFSRLAAALALHCHCIW